MSNHELNNAVHFGQLEAIEGIQLTPKQMAGDVAVIGKAGFVNLLTPGGAPGIAPKYGAQVLIPKGSDDARILFAVFQHVSDKCWGVGHQKGETIVSQLANGLSGMNSNISVDCGDLISPEFNGGCWLVKANNPDQPILLDEAGQFTQEPSKKGDGVRLIFNAWGQKTRERINLKCLAVQTVVRGVDKGGPTPEQIAETVSEYVAEPLPALVAGVVPRQGALPQGAAQAPQSLHQRVPAQAPAPAPQQAASVPQGPPQGSIFRGAATGGQPNPIEESKDGGPDIIDM
jgi:hypothetical protein